MRIWRSLAGCCAFILASAGLSLAQDSEPVPVEEASSGDDAETANTDEMASSLNSQQKLRRTYTLQRTINGELVDEEQRTLTFEPGDPRRPTEAGGDPVAAMKADFASRALTRNAAFEEAKVNFTLADLNRDGFLDADEFARFAAEQAAAARPTEITARPAAEELSDPEARRRAFVEELALAPSVDDAEAQAREKFAFMSGAADALSRQDYIREYLLDFDSMDVDGNGYLHGEELARFRALTRGSSAQ